MALPVSAFAQSFTVTTNKDIYRIDERAIFVGTVPDSAPDGYAVLIVATGTAGDCIIQQILPAADNSYMSRPLAIDRCGFGQVTVSASYAEERATSTFIISNNRGSDAGNTLELRTIRNVILQAQESATARVKELVENNYILPEEVARKYGEGVSKVSLALQAIEFGDVAEARKHSTSALKDFREVLAALTDENVARFEQTIEQRTANSDNSDVVGTYNKLQQYYYLLAELSGKNDVDVQSEFEVAAQLLSEARRLIGERDFMSASLHLEEVSILLDEIRTKLVGHEQSNLEFVSYANITSKEDIESARKLIEAADRFEKTALGLLSDTRSEGAKAKLQEALSLIASTRVSIEEYDLDSARNDLSAAYLAINEAQDLAREESRNSAALNNNDNSSRNNNDNSSRNNNDNSSRNNNDNSSRN
ncbi:MAG: hypothetical protein HRF40_09710, partial [Nitrososphaera sp.]